MNPSFLAAGLQEDYFSCGHFIFYMRAVSLLPKVVVNQRGNITPLHNANTSKPPGQR